LASSFCRSAYPFGGTRTRWRRRYSPGGLIRSAARVWTLAAARLSPAARADSVITAGALAASLALLIHGLGSPQPRSQLDWRSGLLAAAETLPLLVWRRSPLGVFTITAGVSALTSALGYVLHVPVAPTVALYLLAASRDERTPWSSRMTATVGVLFLTYLAANAAAGRAFPWLPLILTSLAWGVAWFAGERTRLRRGQIAELKERALQERRLAVAEERARIARDLHDSAGHAINVIAVRAGAARLRHREDPDRSLDALRAIEEVARQTAADVDRIVHALREGDAARSDPVAPPGLASLETLIAGHSQASLDIEWHRSGTPRQLDPSVDQTVYRILQEGLTNAARHGRGPVTIELAFDDRELGLTVTNSLRNGTQPHSREGHGLIGMRERAALLGGTLEARRSGSAFRVAARIPYGGHQD
jgi:signal transduction histidine kinase